MNIRNISRVAGFVVATSLAAAGLASSAHADDTPPTPDIVQAAEQATDALDEETATAVMSTVEELATMSEVVGNGSDATVTQSDGSTVTVEAGNSIEVPASADDPVQVTTSEGDVVAIELSLPAGAEAVVVGGLSIYPTEHGSITQQATNGGGAQTIFTLDGPDAPTSYAVEITLNEGGVLALQPDGSVAILGADGTTSSGVAAPWAKDANDVNLPTWYTVDGNTLTQHIDTSNVTAWPVTADPFWSVFGSYMKCVLGIGVPIGAAAAFVAYVGWSGLQVLATNKAATYVPGGPPWVGRIVKPYASAVWNNCARFIRS